MRPGIPLLLTERTMRRTIHLLPLLGIGMLSIGCTRVPAGLQPVTGFDGQRYMGKLY